MANSWEIVIGLEIHAQVVSLSKLFSRSPVSFGDEPNTNVSEIDLALPGALPLINRYAIMQALRTGLGLNAKINLLSYFDRKHYFYPDLPSGYQISQFSLPVVGEGEVEITVSGESKKIGINRIHLEQDAGKSMHDQNPQYTFIDLNRAGVALMEIVTYPDMRSAVEAIEFIKKLRSILRYLGTCDGDMEKGSMRCDINISIRRFNEGLGNRVEVKNVNSIKNVTRAIEYEYQRQVEEREAGRSIRQETRLFDANSGETRSLRSKEDAADYRYLPDPDILPIHIDAKHLEDIRVTIPELPDQKKARYMKELSLGAYDVEVIIVDPEVARYFEEMIEICNPKLASNWLTAELFGYLNKNNLEINQSPISALRLANLVKLIDDNVISGKLAKQVFEIMSTSDQDPIEIVKSHGLLQITDNKAIEEAIDKILAQFPKEVAEYHAGKEKLFGFFVGNIMKETKGKVNPTLLNEILKQKLLSK